MKFDFYGLYNGVLTMYDRSTQTVWLQIGGRAIKGPMTGQTLKTGPVMDTTWRQWRSLHPDTLVMSPQNPYRANYDPDGVMVPRGYDKLPAPYFRKTITHRDKRLPDKEMVLAIALRGGVAGSDQSPAPQPAAPSYRAYPIRSLRSSSGAVNDFMGPSPVAIFFERGSETAVALSRILDGQTLTFETRNRLNGKPVFYDRETGSRWNIEGVAEEGLLIGKSLDRLDSTMSEWYGWAAYFPQTSIWNPTDPHKRPSKTLMDGSNNTP